VPGQSQTLSSIRAILGARSVAVVGVSSNTEKWGYIILENILAGGYQGKLYGVNPKIKQILGIEVFPTVLDLPDEIDILIICVPAAQVKDVLSQAIEKKVKGVILVTSGFREVGHGELEQEILEQIKDSGLRIIGPNIAGLTYLPNKFIPNVTTFSKKLGPIGIIAQSGSVSAIIGEWAEEEGIGITGLINLGNQIDLCETDFIEFFCEDEETKTIVLYLEGPKDGERFKEPLKKTALQKPIVVLKPGKTAGGRTTAMSHTASIAGDDRIFSVACRQLGVIRAEDNESLFDYAKIFALMDLPQGNRIQIISSSGGIAALVVDELESCGLILSQMPAEVALELEQSLSLASANFSRNPIDMPGFIPENFLKVVEVLGKYDLSDAYLFIFADPIPGIEKVMPEIVEKCKKPVAVIYIGGGEVGKEGTAEMIRKGIPVYPTPGRAVRSLAQAVWYSEFRRSSENE
jgi:acyl-CoA synthetase (NDP forming)